MKRCLVLLLCTGKLCFGQSWEAEIMAGASGYNGDLTQHLFSLRTIGPSAGLTLKYNLNNTFLIRAGVLYGSIHADDRNNHRPDLRARNLNFATNITETNLSLEVNLFDPDYFILYPYVYAGVGLFHFNPYTHDASGNKVYLQPLGTEGQGLAEYPNRKPYELTQFCLPFGGGLKLYLSKKCDLEYELAGRALFTDYLDDVSTTYVRTQTLMTRSRPQAAELAYRQTNAPFPSEGDIRGNPKVKDWYWITAVKLLIRLGKHR